MGSRSGKRPKFAQKTPQRPVVRSLLEKMNDGNEYGSIVGLAVADHVDLVQQLREALAEIEAARKRPCVAYLANVVRDMLETGISKVDHLPFNEMISQVPVAAREVDVFLVTPGGSGHQVTQFVDGLRPRFDRVEFLLPYMAMSAGTLWALSGERIWMDERAFIGPIDPQVPNRDGRLVPAQSLLLLMEEIGRRGEAARASGGAIPWHLIALLNSMDKHR